MYNNSVLIKTKYIFKANSCKHKLSGCCVAVVGVGALLHLVKVTSHHAMLLQGGSLYETLATGATYEGTLARVLLQMEFQILRLAIALVAVGALVWLQSAVRQHVPLQLVGPGEILATDRAMEGLLARVHSPVRHHLRVPREGHFT